MGYELESIIISMIIVAIVIHIVITGITTLPPCTLGLP